MLEARQPLLHVAGEGAGADIVQHVGMTVEAFQQLVQGAVFADAVEEAVHFLQQALVLAASQCPGHGLRRAEVEAHMQRRIEGLVDQQFVGIDHGEIDFAVIDQTQQVDGLQGVGFLEHQLRMLGLQLAQLIGQGAALEYRDALVVEILEAFGLALAAPVDDLRGNLQIGLGKLYLTGAVGVGGQAGGGDVRPALAHQLMVQIIQRRAGNHLQLQIQAVGKALAQLVLQPGVPMATLVIGSRRIAGQHAQGAILAQLLETIGLLAGHQKYRAQQGQGGGSEMIAWVARHGLSICKSAQGQ